MRRCGCLLIAGCALWLTVGTGCSHKTRMWTNPHARKANLGQEPDEHYHYVSRMMKHHHRALVDDLDIFFMTDRPSRLTRWHTK